MFWWRRMQLGFQFLSPVIIQNGEDGQQGLEKNVSGKISVMDALGHLMAIARIVKGGNRIGYWQKNSENHERKRNVTKAIG